MLNDVMKQALAKQLFATAHATTYAVLDGASVDGLLPRFARDNPEHICLYRGELEPDLAEAAPYLVRLEAESDFTRWVLEQGWGEHWGVFATAEADMRAMRQHFRRFLMVHDETGKPLYFRYYDPRVLRVYLPTCNEKELQTVFGPITHYYSEAEDPNELLQFSVSKGALSQREFPLTRPAR
jgi:hypothetical protein